MTRTIFEAAFFVVLVILVFLQSWRAALIPLVAIPISLIGTFTVMALLGFSLNSLSLFGIVLAIGIVVDDAIVVVENIQRNLGSGLQPREAARKAMGEITSAVISATLVMSAVFIPTAFLPGISGQFYQQFAITIAVAVAISGFTSLTLSPALGALILRSQDAPPDRFQRLINVLFGWFFRGFNFLFGGLLKGYHWSAGRFVRQTAVAGLLFLGLVFLTGWGFRSVPGGFIPAQDQGYGIVALQLPDAASLDRSDALMQDVIDRLLAVDGIAHVVSFAGFNGATFAASPSAAALFPVYESFEARGSERTGDEILADMRAALGNIREAFTIAIPPPPVSGIGNGGGFRMMIQDRTGLGNEALEGVAFAMMGAAAQESSVTQVFSPFRANTPQLYADIDREKAKLLNINLQDVFDTLQVNLGSIFVNEFNLFGRTYRVTAQADGPFRDEVEDIRRLRTRTLSGDMVPLGSFTDVAFRGGPDRVLRYNLYPAADLQGAAARGFSSNQSLATMERLATEQLLPGMSFEWTELAYQQRQAGNTAMFIFFLSAFFVFLVLVAQYESWSIPLAVILIIPLCLTGAIWFTAFRGFDNNILTQIGFVVLIGLAAKNAILIVEFARQREKAGEDRFAAAVEAARLRLRPILMTSFAFIFGVLPLVFAQGAGAEMRQAIGSAVFGGMLLVTLLGLFFTPFFYVVIRGIGAKRQLEKPTREKDPEPDSADPKAQPAS